MAMTCDDELLQRYVEGDLTPAERVLVTAHLSGCAACTRTVMQYKALMWDLSHPESAPVPPELAAVSDRLMAAWEEAARAGKEPKLSPLELGLLWTRTPPLQSALLTAGRVGRQLPSLGLTGLKGLWRLARRGGGRR
jgi:anti-sigma factor RsiW